MRIFMLVTYTLLILIGVSFAALNSSSVSVNFYFKTLSMPISVLILIPLMLVLGVLVGLVLFVLRYWRLKDEYRKIKNQLRLTEKEIKNLRAIPLQDQH